MRLPLPISGAIATAAIAGSLFAASLAPPRASTPICGDPLPSVVQQESEFVAVPVEFVEAEAPTGVSVNTDAGAPHLRFHQDGVSMYVGQPAEALVVAWGLPGDAQSSSLIRHEGLVVQIADGRVASIEVEADSGLSVQVNGTNIHSLAQLPGDEALGACLDTVHSGHISATCPHLGMTVFMNEAHGIGVYLEGVE